MKKLFSMFMVASLVLSLGSTAMAATINQQGGSTNSKIQGKFVAPPEEEIFYSVDVVFGNMEFSYTPATNGTWHPDNHTYTEPTEEKWVTNGVDDNLITVTNHTNKGIIASLTYAQLEESGVAGRFDNDQLPLDSAAVGESLNNVENAPKGTSRLTIDSGVLAEDVIDLKAIAEITVAISDQ